jgi:hypothetical protein
VSFQSAVDFITIEGTWSVFFTPCWYGGMEEARLAENIVISLRMQGDSVFSVIRVRWGRENVLNRCSSTRRYDAEVTHVILHRKARTTFNKRISITGIGC